MNKYEPSTFFKTYAKIFRWDLEEYNFDFLNEVAVPPSNQSPPKEGFALNEIFDHIYIINLEKDVEKYKITQDALQAYGISASRFEAINGLGVLEEYRALKKLHDESATAFWIREGLFRSPGCYGSTLSRITILKDAVYNKYKKILILEDDIILHRDFHKLFHQFYSQLPHDWKILRLGASENSSWEDIKIEKSLYRYASQPKTYGGFATGIDASVYEELLLEYEKKNGPNDVKLTQFAATIYPDKNFVCFPNLVIANLNESGNNAYTDKNNA